MFHNFVLFAQSSQFNDALQESRSTLERIGDSLLSTRSIVTLVISMTLALILGRMIAAVLRRATKIISARTDKIENLNTVNKLRRIETLIVLSIAAIRTLLVMFAIYFWWVSTYNNQQSTAILGAGAILTIVLSLSLRPALSDLAAGATMMAEHWYGVGDHIRIEPFLEAQGVVERVTLRSTKLRKVTGEVFWVNNKDIAGVSVTPKGVRTVAIELYAKDLKKANELIDSTNLRLPQGALAVVSPLTIMTQSQIASQLWHLTAISEVAPGREWLLDKFAIDVLKELDDKHKILAHEPISRYADSEAERRFARTILNARKSRIERENVARKVVRKAHLHSDGRKHKSTAKAKSSKSAGD